VKLGVYPFNLTRRIKDEGKNPESRTTGKPDMRQKM
jgi:hypothetical protein